MKMPTAPRSRRPRSVFRPPHRKSFAFKRNQRFDSVPIGLLTFNGGATLNCLSPIATRQHAPKIVRRDLSARYGARNAPQMQSVSFILLNVLRNAAYKLYRRAFPFRFRTLSDFRSLSAVRRGVIPRLLKDDESLHAKRSVVLKICVESGGAPLRCNRSNAKARPVQLGLTSRQP